MTLSLKIALRFLETSRMQTVLIILGIAVGVSVQIFIALLIQSLQVSLVDSTIGNSPQVKVEGVNGTFAGWEPMVTAIEKNPSAIHVTVTADSPALLVRDNRTRSVFVKGLDFTSANGIYKIEKRLNSGIQPNGKDEVIVGKLLADESGIAVGDRLVIVIANGTRFNLTVTGFFDLGVASLNRGWFLVEIGTAQSIFGFGTNVTGIEMQVSDVFAADTVASDLRTSLSNSSLKVSNWKDDNADLLQGLSSQSMSSYIIQVSVILSVTIAIASVLAITVLQKSRQLGILKAMGITDSTASRIFLLEGFFLGAAGAFCGVLLGLFLLYGFTMGARNPDGTPVIPIIYNWTFVFASWTIATLSSVIAAAIPALRSSRLSPVEVIRNG